MKKSLIFFSLLALLFACNHKEKESLELSQKQVTDLMTDIQLMESLMTTHRDFRDPAEHHKLFEEILKKHNIDQEKFDSIMAFLDRNVDYYKLVLDSMAARIENMDTLELPLLKYADTLKKPPLKRKFKKN